jgi:hypothetical protein
MVQRLKIYVKLLFKSHWFGSSKVFHTRLDMCISQDVSTSLNKSYALFENHRKKDDW